MTLRHILQRETDEQHRSLDMLVDGLGCFADVTGYARWLRGMHAFHDAVRETFLASGLWAPRVRRQEERVDLLNEDLGDLAAPRIVQSLPRPFTVVDEESALGIRYVVEGASLGSRVLATRAAALGCTATRGARYLAGEVVSFAHWREVLGDLAAAELDEAAIRRAVAASRRTFELASLCLGGRCHA